MYLYLLKAGNDRKTLEGGPGRADSIPFGLIAPPSPHLRVQLFRPNLDQLSAQYYLPLVSSWVRLSGSRPLPMITVIMSVVAARLCITIRPRHGLNNSISSSSFPQPGIT